MQQNRDTKEEQLHHIVRAGTVPDLKFLLDQAEYIDARGAEDNTPLGQAAFYGRKDVLDELLKRGADIEARNVFEETPLVKAIRGRRLECVKHLVEAGADVEGRNTRGTALHVTVEVKELEIARMLCKHGARLDFKNAEGHTPQSLAESKSEVEFVKLFEELETARAIMKDSSVPDFGQDFGSYHQTAFVPMSQPHELWSEPARNQERRVQDHSVVQANIYNAASQSLNFTAEEPHRSSSSSEVPGLISGGQPEVPPMWKNKAEESLDSVASETPPERAGPRAAVQQLTARTIFNKNYRIEPATITGKPLMKIATGVTSGETVILKFYDQEILYRRAVRFYEHLCQCNYVCKPNERVDSANGLPNCLIFAKGSYTLDAWLRIPDITLGNKRDALQLIATALEEIHGYGVVHCDLKPANLVFFHEIYKWKILDLDSAFEDGQAAAILTTRAYAAPEVLRKIQQEDSISGLHLSCDMWSYGIIAYEVLTGSRFYDQDFTVDEQLDFLNSEAFESRLDQVEDETHRHFIKRFLQLDPSKRRSAADASKSSLFRSGSFTTTVPV